MALGRANRDRDGARDRSYRAEARGYLYFLIDRPDTDQRTLVRADQLAVDLFHGGSGRTRQRIVGRRGEERLPTDIRYHLDHLTVVTDDFDDRITVGDGDEVRSVPHPLADGSESHYDFRLEDSLTISLPGGRDPVRAREIEVRPKRADRPGVVGSLHLDRATGGVVRMNVTFTSASYVDPTVDYIRISLRNGRWEGGAWLPYRQEIELRRELTFLDFSTGSLILVRYRIGAYDFDADIAESLLTGPPISIAEADRLASFPFERDLYAELDEGGLSPTPDLEEARRGATRLLAERHLSGLGPLRPAVSSASTLFRYNRAEGAYAGGGASYRRPGVGTVRTSGGYAFGPGRPAITVSATTPEPDPSLRIEAFWNTPRDLGPVPGASGALNTVATLAGKPGYLDPYFATGVALSRRIGSDEGIALRVGARVERHRSAANVLDRGTDGGGGTHRPVLPIDEGTDASIELRATSTPAEGWSATGDIRVGRFEGREYVTGQALLEWSRRWLGPDVALSAEVRGGWAGTGAPLQTLHHLGGRETMPGYAYRGYTGDRYWLARTEASWGILSPWLRPRAFGSVGSADLRHHRLPDSWPGEPTPIPLFSAAVGVGLFWDVVRLDVGRGLNGGGWEWILSVNPTFRPFL